MVEIIDYNIYTTPFRDLPCLEDAIQKGYSTDDEQNKTMSITIREYPASMPYGIESLIEEGWSNYFSVIERHAVYYGISVLQNQVQEIVKSCRKISKTGNVLENDMLLYNSLGLPFKTRAKQDMSHVYMPSWCREWISSNHRYLNMPAGSLAVYIVMFALSTAEIINPHVQEEINIESKWFKKYLETRLEEVKPTV